MVKRKTCSRCGVSRPRPQFNRRARAADGLQSACKTCESIAGWEYRQDVVVRINEADRAKAWRLENRERVRAYDRARRP
jgi:hypothetical protein